MEEGQEGQESPETTSQVQLRSKRARTTELEEEKTPRGIETTGVKEEASGGGCRPPQRGDGEGEREGRETREGE